MRLHSGGFERTLRITRSGLVTHYERPRAAGCSFTVDIEVGRRQFAGHNDELEAIFYAHRQDFRLRKPPAPKEGVLLKTGDDPAGLTADCLLHEWCREVGADPQAKISLGAGSTALRGMDDRSCR